MSEPKPGNPVDPHDLLADGAVIDEPAPIEERIALGGRSLREHTARGAIINAAFHVGIALLGLLKRVAVAAFLLTTEYGLWGVLVTMVITLTWLKQVGINDKYVQQEERDQEAAFQKAFTLELLYTLCFYAFVLALLPVFALAYGRSEILLPGLLLSTVLLSSAFQAPIWIAYRQMRFVRQRALESLDPLISTVITISLAAAGAGYWSLVIGTVAGSVAAAVAAVVTSPYRLRWRFEREALREYFGFSWPLFLSGVAGVIVVQGSVLIGNYAVGLAGLGALALAQTFAMFADRVDQIIRQTIYPAVCAVTDQRALLYEAFEKSNRLALMWGLTFGVALALFAPDLITFVLGERWREAEFLMQAIGLIIGFRQVAFNWTVFMRALGETRPIAINAGVLVVMFLIATAPLFIIFDLKGYAYGMAIALAADLSVRAYFLRRLFTGFRMLRHIARAVAPSVPATGVVLLIRLATDLDRTPVLALGELTVYLATTVVATLLFERALMRELTGYLRGGGPAPTPAPG